MILYQCPKCEAEINTFDLWCKNCDSRLDWGGFDPKEENILPSPPEKTESIDSPVLSWWEDSFKKYHIVMSIPIGKRNFPFTFGWEKAKAIIKWHETIQGYFR